MAGPSGQDCELRNRQDEAAAALLDRRHALHDLLLDIPRQDQQEVRLGLKDEADQLNPVRARPSLAAPYTLQLDAYTKWAYADSVDTEKLAGIFGPSAGLSWS